MAKVKTRSSETEEKRQQSTRGQATGEATGETGLGTGAACSKRLQLEESQIKPTSRENPETSGNFKVTVFPPGKWLIQRSDYG